MRAVRPAFAIALVLSAAAVFGQTLPTNAKPTCTGIIAPWFQGGAVTLNGFVNPPNSLQLNTSNNCNFYLWSEQMYLWMTSPAPPTYGGSGRVFQSPVFYGVTSCPSNNGDLCFVPQFGPNTTASTKATAAMKVPPPFKSARLLPHLRAALRPAKRGPHGLPVVIDRKGHVIEVTDAQLSPKGKPIVVGANGRVEVSKITRDAATQKIRFIDAAGNVITNPRPLLTSAMEKAHAATRFFTTNRTAVVVAANGAVLDVSPEQADNIGAVLLSQMNPSAPGNSVVYYTVAVNDVYAWFVAGIANGAISSSSQFPTTQSDLNQIVAFAARYGATLTDANALTLEVKMSWVNASTLSNPSSYVTTVAEVPVYNTSSTASWPQTTTHTATLALIGVHVVGTSNGHPEMIWSTFEHFNNTPNATYQYTNTGGTTSTVNQSTSGSWLLTANGSAGPFNVAHANYLSAPTITAQPSQTISRSDTLRVHPFGVAPTGVPNQNDATPAIANTEVIAINNSILGQLASGDIRKNYYFVGSTWTDGGYAPTYPFPVLPSGTSVNGAQIGTSYLANSTMETYVQAAGTSSGTNCFSCHNNGGGTPPPSTLVTTNVSHIFQELLSGLKPSSAATAKPKK
jgi:hypothetical protein